MKLTTTDGIQAMKRHSLIKAIITVGIGLLIYLVSQPYLPWLDKKLLTFNNFTVVFVLYPSLVCVFHKQNIKKIKKDCIEG